MDEPLSHMSALHRSALEASRAWTEALPQISGLLATGSLVRGEGHARSDIDLVVLWRRSGRQRFQRFFNGVPVEVFANSRAWLQYSMCVEAKSGRPVMAHMLATGTVLRDDTGCLAVLVGEAQRLMSSAPARPEDGGVADRYSAACAVEDALDLLSDQADTESIQGDTRLVLYRAVDAMIEYAFSSRGQWLPRGKQRLAALAEADPESSMALQAVMDASSKKTAAVELDAVARMLVGSTGFFEWESSLQAEDPPAT